MKTLLKISLLISSVLSFSQISQNQNNVHTIDYTEGVNVNNVINNSANRIENVSYFDGVGRIKQGIRLEAGGAQEDIIQHFAYDGYGRQLKTYLPYAKPNNSGSFEPMALNGVEAFYNTSKYESTNNPYNLMKIEESPRARLEEMAFPGNDWEISQGHTVRNQYSTNQLDDEVRFFGVHFVNNNKQTPELLDNGLYAIGELQKYIQKNENWSIGQNHPQDNTEEHYIDRYGRQVLSRKFEQGKWFDTYYVYDIFGNLTYVLPPKVNTYFSLDQTYSVDQDKTFYDVLSIYDDDPDDYDNKIEFSFSGTQMTVRFEEDEEVEMELDDGKVLELNFNPPLPNIQLGMVEVFDSDGDEIDGAEAYILNGDLYFDSLGELSYGMDVTLVRDLSNYPSPQTNITINEIDELAYQYVYDADNRLISKKIPGKDWEHIVYDKLDRPILVQDGNLRSANQWLFTKYDALDRPVYSGILNTTASRAGLQSTLDSAISQNEIKLSSPIQVDGNNLYYSNSVFPTVGISDLLTINYYDDYNWDIESLSNPNTVFGSKTLDSPRNLPTGSKIRVLNSNHWITNVSYYDTKRRLIFSGSENELFESKDITKIELNFLGKPIRTIRNHYKESNPVIKVQNTFGYDHMSRILNVKQKINNGPEEVISQNVYDELGKLIAKKIGNSDSQPLQEIDYKYNIRGWIKSINDPTELSNDLFAFGIGYQEILSPSTSTSFNNPNYNGNIGHVMWLTDNKDHAVRHYSYGFDTLNRLKDADYGENDSMVNKYDEHIYNYDRNGNILDVYRSSVNPNNTNYGLGIDRLEFEYSGNRLDEVRDIYNPSSPTGMKGFKDGNLNGTDYFYDLNGNMTSDKNKGITSIIYNHLNLAEQITVSNGSSGADGNIIYTYDANGNRLFKQITDIDAGNSISSTKYINGFTYEIDGTGERLRMFDHQEGYVQTKYSGSQTIPSGFEYVYQYKDHLGNIRLSYSDADGNGQITGASTQVFFDDFEDSVEGVDWNGALYGWQADDFDSNFKLSGNRSARLDTHGHWEKFCHSNEWININNSSTTDYMFFGWVFLENVPGNKAQMFLMMKETGETGYNTLFDYVETSLRGRWVYIEKIFSVPSNITSLNLRIDNDHSGKVWFDNVGIRKINNSLSVEIIEEKNYYPFGLQHEGYNEIINGTENNYQTYNGVEIIKSLNIKLHNFAARSYDASICRWNNSDPLSDWMPSYSPYSYGFNNPIFYKDSDGRSPVGMYNPYLIYDGKENKIYIYDDNDTPMDRSDDVLIGTHDAHNNVTRRSKGKWPDGTYKMFDTKKTWKHPGKYNDNPMPREASIHAFKIPQDSRNGSYGVHGIFRAEEFTQWDGKNRSGMGVHSGREYKTIFERRVTQGCIRTTTEAMEDIQDAIDTYGDLTEITVQNNYNPWQIDEETVLEMDAEGLAELESAEISVDLDFDLDISDERDEDDNRDEESLDIHVPDIDPFNGG